MKTLRITTTILPILALCQAPVEAGLLRDFEQDASSGESDESDDSHNDSGDDGSCGLCDLLEIIFDSGDDDDSHNAPPPPRYTYSDPPEFSGNLNLDLEAQIGLRHGFWGKQMYGNQLEALLTMNSLILGMESTWDAERISDDQEDHMNITRIRAGVAIGEDIKFLAMAGFSTLTGAQRTGYFSTRLGVEYLNKHVGTRFVWDGDFGNTMGFQDLQAVGILKTGPVEWNAGYRFRITSGREAVMIHGPQIGLTFRFGGKI